MSNLNEVSAVDVEHAFGLATESGRFTSLCNALLASKTLSAAVGYPSLSEKPGPDGSLDGEWTISADFAGLGGLAIAGWNVFQFKTRGLSGATRSQVLSNLKSSLRGAAKEVAGRLATTNKTPSHYVLFTNLQLGLETPTVNKAGAEFSKDREELKAAIRGDAADDLKVTIIDAGNLAAELNANPALKLTYFSPGIAKTWEEKWGEESKASGLDQPTPLIGREAQLKELATWLADDVVRVIAIDGPAGMGKTRLALEATRAHRMRTTVVESPTDFERLPLAALAAAAVPRIIILEDPADGLAQRIAKQALTQSRLKLIFTLPSRDKAPWFSPDETAIKAQSLPPLEREPADKLLKVANPHIDSDVVDYILQRAGGIPFVILNGAQYGNELREKAGTLQQRLAQKFSARIERDVGADGLEALRLISPLQWTAGTGERSELPLLCELFPQSSNATRIADLLDRLVRMGFARRRGDFYTVTPPIFAAALAEGVHAALPAAIRTLFDRSPDDGRRRLLERVVTLDLGEVERFWTHVFHTCGANAETILEHSSMFHTLARANPAGTARHLELHLGDLMRVGADSTSVSELTSATRELIYNDPTCRAGMRIMQGLAIAYPDSSADKRFHDAFVHWFYTFPLGYAERFDWLKRLLGSADPGERQLGAEALAHASSIPQSMSGYEVTARRMGSAPPVRKWTEVHDYLENVFRLRFDLLGDPEPAIATLMAQDLTGALTRLTQHVPAVRLNQILGRFMQLFRDRVVIAKEVDVRRLLEFVAETYDERRSAADAAHRADWDRLLSEIRDWVREFDEGPFLRRFKIAIARAHDWDEVEFEGRKMYSNEVRCRQLAHEVIASPDLMTEETWQMSESPEAWTFHPFVAALCEYDQQHAFLPILEIRGQQPTGARNLAVYLVELSRRDATLATARFNALVATLPKETSLVIMDHFRHSPEHRALLKQWMGERTIDPAVLGASLGRRSLDDVPPADVAEILEYVATDPNNEHQVIRALSAYVYREKPLPRELFPLALRLLKSIKQSDQVHHDCSLVAIAIARTEKDAAFALLREQVEIVHNEKNLPADDLWDPFGRFKAHNFWKHLVATWPEESYRELLQLKGVEFHGVFVALVDPDKHQSILLKLSADVVAARFFSARMGGAQPGFYEFAFAVLSLHPGDAALRTILVRSAMSGEFEHAFDANHHRQLLPRLEERLKDATLTAHHRSWLEAARDKAQAEGKLEERIFGHPDQRPGWE